MAWHLPLWLLSPSKLAFRRWRLELWRDTAQSCGLRVVGSSHLTASRLRIEAREGPVTVSIEAPGDPESCIRVEAAFPGPPGFSSMRIYRLDSVPPWTRDLVSGDRLFDEAFSIRGSAGPLSALLDAEMRRLLLSFKAESRLEICRGALHMETSDENLSDVLPSLLDLTRRLTEERSVMHRLAENARHDPDAGVRIRNLFLLTREFPEASQTATVLRAACSDTSPQVRLRAALELGPQGRDVLVELAESLEDDACAAEAVARLGRELGFKRTCAVLSGALRRRRLQAALACLEWLGRGEASEAVGLLLEVMEREEGELAVAAAKALGTTASPAAEPSLILALRREPADLRVVAAEALAPIGTAAAVLPLREAAERSPDNPELRRAAHRALAEIKSRLHGVSPGQLSLAQAEAGQLSLTQDEAGQLSLAHCELAVEPLPPDEMEPPARGAREKPAGRRV